MPKRKAHVRARSQTLAKWRKKREEEDSPPSQDPPPPPVATTSAQKRKSLLSDEDVRKKGIEKKRIIIEEEDLETLVGNAACGECFSRNNEVKFTHHMLDTYFSVKCECGAVLIDTNETRKPYMGVREILSHYNTLYLLHDDARSWV